MFYSNEKKILQKSGLLFDKAIMEHDSQGKSDRQKLQSFKREVFITLIKRLLELTNFQDDNFVKSLLAKTNTKLKKYTKGQNT